MADDPKSKGVSRAGHDLPVVPMQVYRFDGKGGVEEVGIEQAKAPPTGKGFIAVAGVSGTPEFRVWLGEELGGLHADNMAAPDLRARCTVVEDHALVVLRVVRKRPDPDDIKRQTIALFVEKGRVILATRTHLPEFFDVAQWRQTKHAPISPADLVARIGASAADRIEPLVEHVGDVLDELEEEIIEGRTPELSARLTRVRQTIISLRRILWPQRDVLNTLEIEDLSFFTERDRLRLREAAGRTGRLGDELQSLSERGGLVHEQILDTRAEQMNRTILVLTSVTVVAMPMTVVSGLLGMNVAGIPFAQNPEAFWLVVLGLAALGTGMVWFMHKRKWL